MKPHQFLVAVLLLNFILTDNLKAQLPAINKLVIIPANPTSNDIVKVIGYTTFSSGGCPLTSSSLKINGTKITLHVCHTPGILTVICNSTDTLIIGKLDAGVYELHYYLYDARMLAHYDLDTVYFTVQLAVGLQLSDNSGQKIDAYPNPVSKEINLEFKNHSAEGYNISFYSVTGQKLKTIKESKNIIKIDISDLADGIYFMVISNEQEKLWSQKIIKDTK
jgi:hypothetical protein